MSTSAQRVTTVQFTGDVTFPLTPTPTANNPTSPASEILMSLSAGDNVIAIPTTGAPAAAVMILKPSGNNIVLKLKGIAGDTGVLLHKTDYDIISLDPTAVSFIINAASQVNGVRLVWM